MLYVIMYFKYPGIHMLLGYDVSPVTATIMSFQNKSRLTQNNNKNQKYIKISQ